METRLEDRPRRLVIVLFRALADVDGPADGPDGDEGESTASTVSNDSSYGTEHPSNGQTDARGFNGRRLKCTVSGL